MAFGLSLALAGAATGTGGSGFAAGYGTPLILGNFAFQDFEIPEEIALGGAQAGALHKLPGGVRIFDAHGPDDDEISWSGRFRGSGAQARALALDGMRRAGSQVPFFVLGLAYAVVIKKFTFKIKRPYEIDYSIVLDVIEDQTQGIGGDILSSLDDVVAGDLSTGAAFLGSIDAASNAAYAAFGAAIAAVPSLQSASPATLGAVSLASYTMTVALATAAGAQDTAILADPLGAAPIDTGAAGLAASLAAMQNEVSLLTSLAYLGRAAANIENIGA